MKNICAAIVNDERHLFLINKSSDIAKSIMDSFGTIDNLSIEEHPEDKYAIVQFIADDTAWSIIDEWGIDIDAVIRKSAPQDVMEYCRELALGLFPEEVQGPSACQIIFDCSDPSSQELNIAQIIKRIFDEYNEFVYRN